MIVGSIPLLLVGGKPQINLSISANAAQYDIFVEAGSPAYPVDVVVTLSSAARVGSVTSGTYAMRTGTGWSAGSTIYLNTGDGTIQGIGGNGGSGSASTAGGAGGDALVLNWPITIENGSGFIYGGGGGGGVGTGGSYEANRSGGGGGRSANTNSAGGDAVGSGAVGTAGTASAAGIGGNAGGAVGGNGGNVGVAGSAGATGSTTAGGAAGKAIKTNSNAITWVSGNDSTHVKGAVAA